MHQFLSFCAWSLAKQGSSRISVVRCCCFCLRSLAKQSPNIKTIRKRLTFLRYRSPCGDCPFTFFTTVQWNADLGATRHALNLKFLHTVLDKTELVPKTRLAFLIVLLTVIRKTDLQQQLVIAETIVFHSELHTV